MPNNITESYPTMRLRLVINRNGLPTMKILWDTSSFQPGDDRNVSSFLTRVSQIVPLESSRWGLEDYAVEIDGFECLHFQEVESVIREGDEVVIRPLSSHEIKQRRLSGRRQISTSGRKLIDGTPFGRTFLRPAPDRPALTIPPRKRRRIGQAEADDSITVQVGSETDESYTEEDKDKETEDDSSSDDEEVVEERRLIPMKKKAAFQNSHLSEKDEDGDGEGEEEEEVENGGKYDNPLMDYYYDATGEVESELDEEEELRRIVEGSSGSEADNDMQEALPKIKNTPANILTTNVNSSDSSSDGDFNPDASQSSDSSSDEEQEEEDDYGRTKVKVFGQPVKAAVEDPQTQSLNIFGITVPSDDESSDGDFDPRTAATEVESSDNEVYSSPEPSSSSSPSPSPEKESSASSSSSEEESEDEIVFQPKKTPPQIQKQKARVRSSSTSSTSSSSSSSSSSCPGPQEKQEVAPRPKGPSVPPGSLPNEGKKSTKARNQRKNENRKLRKLKESGAVPMDMNHTGYLAWVAGKQVVAVAAKTPETPKHVEPVKITTLSKHVTPVKQPEQPKSEDTVKAANRRKRYKKIYNKAKKAGTTNIDFNKWIEEREKQRLVELEKEKEKAKGKDADGDTAMEPTDGVPTEESSKQKTPNRPNIDIPAIQRILLHDLSITKKKAAEEEIMRKEWVATHKGDTANKRKGFAREQFGKKPKKIVYDEDGNPISVSVEPKIVEQREEDLDSWRKKLVLTAVECEWEGVELPEPTFPFKQPSFLRGDVVAGQKRKRGGGKKKKQQHEEYWGYDDYSQNDGYYHQQQQAYDDWSYHDYYDDTTRYTNDKAVNDTVMKDEAPVDDLPHLPADLSTLPPLTKPVLPGTVITFKQLTMDKNYTPVMADYRTAIIEEVIDEEPDGPLLVIRLAIRDRIEREVDKDTGEKVLRKFEMPGDTRADEGKEELVWGELIEPLLVKLPEGVDETTNGEKNRVVDGEGMNKSGSNNGQGSTDGSVDDGGGGVQEAMDDAPDEEQQDRANKGNTGEPTLEQGAFKPPAEEVEEDNLSAKIAATLEEEEEQALLEELAAEMAVGEDEHLIIGTSQEQVLDTPQDAQVTNSPKYSHSYSEFKTPEPEAQVEDTPIVDEEPYISPPIEESAQNSTYESDSDALPTLGSMLASQSQRALIKRESETQDEPQLPPLPIFSPFGIRLGQGEERSLDEQQIQHEVEGAKNVDREGPKKDTVKSGSSQVQVIDLTTISSDPAEEISKKKRRGRGRGRRRGASDVWRAVKS